MKRQTLILVVIGVHAVRRRERHRLCQREGRQQARGFGLDHRRASDHVGRRGQVRTSRPARRASPWSPASLVAIELIPTKSYTPTDLTSLTGLTNEVLTGPVTKGQAISSTELTASTSSISLPTGMDAMTITMSGTNGLAGYLQPGSRVDVYANITKVSTGSSATSTLPLPCTELAMANIQVLDVESTVPSYVEPPDGGRPHHPAAARRCSSRSPPARRRTLAVPRAERVALGRPDPAGTRRRRPLEQCIGTDQTTAAP